jgi:hypothetical protein
METQLPAARQRQQQQQQQQNTMYSNTICASRSHVHA